MNNICTARIIWRGITLDAGYHNSTEFDPVYIVHVDKDGEEGPICDDLLEFLTIAAIDEIGELVKSSGESEALDSIMNRTEWESPLSRLSVF